MLEQPNPASRHLAILVGLILASATLVVYGQVQNHEFVNYDDYEYVVENPHVRRGFCANGVTWAFTSAHASNWHPLTWFSHMVDYRLYGLNSAGHHLNSVLFHLLNSLLLFILLRRTTGALWRSAFVAALFALHPLHVESVAWVSERKDVLSTMFGLMTVLAYVRYVERPGLISYLPVLFLFCLGLMAKPMLVTLPFVLLLLDYWPLERFRRKVAGRTHEDRPISHLIAEKIPLFLLAAGSSLLTFLVQREWGAVGATFSLTARLSNGLVSYATYVWKTFWPLELVCFYPHPEGTLPSWQIIAALLFLICSSWLAIVTRRRHPYLIVGWLWYLGTLVPVIGLVQVGSQAMADRYTYIPLIGLFIMISWGVPRLLARTRFPPIALSILATGLIAVLTVCTWHQVGFWKNSRTLFEHAISVFPDNHIAHNNLGNVYARQGDLRQAAFHYTAALRIKPQNATALNNLGNVLMKKGDLEAAVSHYSKALQKKPHFEQARHNLDLALQKMHQKQALTIHPPEP